MIQTVWLDNPPLNAVDAGIIDTLWSTLENLGSDVHAVVLRGRGERAFSAGADISGFVGGMAEGDRPGGIQPVADLIEAAPVPVVAAIHGFCLGGGLELALGCDVRIAHAGAQLGFPEVNLGLLPGGGGYAEVVAVERAQVVPLPDGASFAEGAGFLLTFLTAYIPLTRQARV
ncbi:MAG TPA: enoyl-CoA hydratase-related protein, partial [Gaiellaceae bacterium]|nr:enoyl-CoA hydratase-related protein [Gaiellaceae bacterium]